MLGAHGQLGSWESGPDVAFPDSGLSDSSSGPAHLAFRSTFNLAQSRRCLMPGKLLSLSLPRQRLICEHLRCFDWTNRDSPKSELGRAVTRQMGLIKLGPGAHVGGRCGHRTAHVRHRPGGDTPDGSRPACSAWSAADFQFPPVPALGPRVGILGVRALPLGRPEPVGQAPAAAGRGERCSAGGQTASPEKSYLARPIQRFFSLSLMMSP